jgi:hypothetical protein
MSIEGGIKVNHVDVTNDLIKMKINQKLKDDKQLLLSMNDVSKKYKITRQSISNIYKKNREYINEKVAKRIADTK